MFEISSYSFIQFELFACFIPPLIDIFKTSYSIILKERKTPKCKLNIINMINIKNMNYMTSLTYMTNMTNLTNTSKITKKINTSMMTNVNLA